MGNLQKLWEWKNTHRTLALEASDAVPKRLVCCQFLARVSSAHRTLAPDATGHYLHVRVHDVS